jgi:hypothetical protein
MLIIIYLLYPLAMGLGLAGLFGLSRNDAFEKVPLMVK